MRELNYERAVALRATGTDHATPTIVPVATGLETASQAVRQAVERGSQRPARDLSAAARALGFGRGLTPPEQPAEPRRSSEDLLALIAGRRPAPEPEPDDDPYADLDLYALSVADQARRQAEQEAKEAQEAENDPYADLFADLAGLGREGGKRQ